MSKHSHNLYPRRPFAAGAAITRAAAGLVLLMVLGVPSLASATPAVGDAGSWQTSPNHLDLAGSGSSGVTGLATVTYNGYLYALGGFDGTSATNKVAYAKLNADGSTGAWQTTTALPAAVYLETAVVSGGYLYEMGGATDGSGTTLATVHYAKINADGTLGAWQAAPSLPGPRYSGTSVVNNGYIYVLGGRDTLYSPNATAYYAKINNDASLGSWQTTTALPNAINDSSAVVSGGYVYQIGGYISGNSRTTVSYAPINSNGTLGSWQTTAALPQGVSAASAITVNGYIYLLGGFSTSFAALNTIYYAPINSDGSVGAWQTSGNTLPSGIISPAAATYNGYAYVLDGSTGYLSGPTHDVRYAQLNFPAATTTFANATNAATVALTTPSGTIERCAAAVAPASLAKADVGYSYPLGLASFCYSTANPTNQITLVFITDLQPAQVLARHYDPTSQTYSTIAGSVITATTYNGHPALQLTYDLADNGAFDSDAATGLVTDPVGLAVQTVSAPATGYGRPSDHQALALIALVDGLLMIAVGLLWQANPHR